MFQIFNYAKYYLPILLRNWFICDTSYSQHGEDLLIEKLLPKGVNTFLDVGANDGVLFSNTYKFAKKGSYGICFEPSRRCFIKLILNHFFHPKIKCLQMAVSSGKGVLFLEESGYENVLSKIVDHTANKTSKVKSDMLDHLVSSYHFLKSIDLVSIDVEGHEHEVLMGGKICLPNAKIIILEIDKCNMSAIKKLPALQNHIAQYTNGVNTFFLNKNFNFPYIDKLPEEFSKC